MKIRHLVALLSVLGTGLLVPADAGAVDQAGMTAEPGQTESSSYPPIRGSAPTSGFVNPDPSTCAGPEAVFCDNVPVEVPAAGQLSFEIGWKDLDAGNNDIDVWLYRTEGGNHTLAGQSASAARPEAINIPAAPAGDYTVVVLNWAGANDGYNVDVTLSGGGAAGGEDEEEPGEDEFNSDRTTTTRPTPPPSSGGSGGTNNVSPSKAKRIVPPQRSSLTPKTAEIPLPDVGAAPLFDATTPTSSLIRDLALEPVAQGKPIPSWVAWGALGVMVVAVGGFIVIGSRQRRLSEPTS